MAHNPWEADKMLDAYIYDYFMKKNLHKSAKAFMDAGMVSNDTTAINARGGFLYEWWSIFWDSFGANFKEAAALDIEQQNAQLQQWDPNHFPHGSQVNAMNPNHFSHGGQVNIAMNSQLQRCDPNHFPDGGQVNAMNSQLQRWDPNHFPHGGQVNPMNSQLQRWDPNHYPHGGQVNAMNSEGITGQSSASFLAMKMYEQQMKHHHPLKSGISPALTDANTMAILRSAANHQGQLLEGNTGNMSGSLQQMHAQMTNTEVNLGNPKSFPSRASSIYGQEIMQSKPGLDTAGSFQGITRLPHKGSMKMTQMPQSSSQHEQLSKQQLQQNNNRERKQHSSLSTHTPGDEINAASSLQHVSSGQKGLMMYGSETAGLAPPENQLDDIDSFLSNDGEDGRTLYDTIKQHPTQHKTESSKGFFLGEVGFIRTRNKITCCHFSSDGKLLASAGHEKKVVLWNMDTLQTWSTPEEHRYLITDVRFRPNSSQLLTASLDKSVKLWDAANPSCCLHSYTGHRSHVMSLDFHPKKTDMFCFCDSKNEIRYWNINPFSCTRVSKQGASSQVRFEPAKGRLLAAASEEVVSISDVETDLQTHLFQGHSDVVNCLCWDPNGEYLASVCKESVKVWSLTSGQCIHELCSKTNKFHSCAFHPKNSAHLVIGGMKSLELWNIAENKSITVPAHEDLIAALAQSPVTGMLASGSHDSYIKLWN